MLVCSAVLLWRRSSWGYLLTSISMTTGCIMRVTLPASIAAPLVQTGQLTPVAAGPLALLCLIGLYIAGRYFWSIQEKSPTYVHAERVKI